MWSQLAILLLSTMSLAQGYYCGDYAYNYGYCLCTDGSWCAPQLYPTVCCDSTKMPSWFSGQWILIDTTDPLNSVSASKPINISGTNISIPWNDATYQRNSNITWSGANLDVDAQNPLHAVAKIGRWDSDLNHLDLTIDLSLDPNPPRNITFSYNWIGKTRASCKGTVTLVPYQKMEEATTRDFLSIYS